MNHLSESNNRNSGEIHGSKINIKFIIGKFLAFMPFFIISISLSLLVAHLVIRYTTPIFSLKTSLLIKDKSRNTFDGAESFLQGSSLLMQSKNIENEIGILKSRNLVEQTLSNINFNISYYSEGKIKKVELYKDLPFIVELDTNHFQTYQVPIYVKFLNNNTVEISSDDKKGKVLIPYNEKEVVDVSPKIQKKVFPINQYIETENLKFKITILNLELLKDYNNGLHFILNTKSSLISKYSGSFNVKTINKMSSIVELTKETSYPEKDIDFLNSLCQTYIQQGLDEKAQISKKTINFINLQLNDIQDTLRTIENNLLNFKTNNKIINLSEEGKLILAQLKEIESQKVLELSKFKYYSYLYDYINKNKNIKEVIAPSALGIGDPLLNSLIIKLSDLYAKKITYSNSMKEVNPAILEIDQNISNIKISLVENLNNIKNQSKLLVADLESQIKLIEKDLNNIPLAERQFLNINRKFNISDKLYTYLLEKRAEAGIAGASVIADNKVIDKTIVTGRTYPIPNTFYFTALMIGILLPSIVILIIDFLNSTITNHKELQEITTIPIIGNIVHNDSKNALVIANSPKSNISESFRNLRSNLNTILENKNNKVILVTSTVSGEGKTFISMNLASVFAIGNAKTLLIGVDLRKPKIFQDFNLDNALGLTNFLIGKAQIEDIIQKTDIPNLDIITAGPTPPNPSELLISEQFEKLLDLMKDRYDQIILDTPPIGLVADGLDLMRFADFNLYIVRQRKSKASFLNLINGLYKSDKTDRIAIVFNDINFAAVYGYGYGSEYGYGYGYSYGYKYGYNYSYGNAFYGYGYGYGTYGNYGSEDEVRKTKKPLWKRLLGF